MLESPKYSCKNKHSWLYIDVYRRQDVTAVMQKERSEMKTLNIPLSLIDL